MPEAKPIASTSAALDPHKPTPTPGDAKSPFGAKATRLPCGSEDEDEREADEDGVAPVKKGKEGEGKRPTPVPIPDQRLENNFIASIRNYVQPIDAGEGGKKAAFGAVRIQWNKVLTVVLVDQIFWPLVLGFGLSVGTVWFSSFQAWRRRA